MASSPPLRGSWLLATDRVPDWVGPMNLHVLDVGVLSEAEAAAAFGVVVLLVLPMLASSAGREFLPPQRVLIRVLDWAGRRPGP